MLGMGRGCLIRFGSYTALGLLALLRSWVLIQAIDGIKPEERHRDNRGTVTRHRAGEEGAATAQVRGEGGSYQPGDGAGEEEQVELIEAGEVKPAEPVSAGTTWSQPWFPHCYRLDGEVATRVGEMAGEVEVRRVSVHLGHAGFETCESHPGEGVRGAGGETNLGLRKDDLDSRNESV